MTHFHAATAHPSRSHHPSFVSLSSTGIARPCRSRSMAVNWSARPAKSSVIRGSQEKRKSIPRQLPQVPRSKEAERKKTTKVRPFLEGITVGKQRADVFIADGRDKEKKRKRPVDGTHESEKRARRTSTVASHRSFLLFLVMDVPSSACLAVSL